MRWTDLFAYLTCHLVRIFFPSINQARWVMLFWDPRLTGMQGIILRLFTLFVAISSVRSLICEPLTIQLCQGEVVFVAKIGLDCTTNSSSFRQLARLQCMEPASLRIWCQTHEASVWSQPARVSGVRRTRPVYGATQLAYPVSDVRGQGIEPPSSRIRCNLVP